MSTPEIPVASEAAELDGDACERAYLARDRRFDGRFFIGVKTTGIYCRPICPVPPPKRRNIDFYRTAAAAEEAGFRPCLRCRPEAAPGSPAWRGTSASVRRALRLIEEGSLDQDSVEQLASKLGIGERHLRRLFQQHVGASPMTVARNRRLLLAKQLIDGGDLPMSEVAHASGFGSIRSFNQAIRKTWDKTPTELRGRRKSSRSVGEPIEVRLGYREPLSSDLLLGFLAPRAVPAVAEVEQGSYRRTFRLPVAGAGEVSGWLQVDFAGPGLSRGVSDRVGKKRTKAPGSALEARIHIDTPAALLAITDRLRRLFDLYVDPTDLESAFGDDPVLGPRLERQPGIRVPGCWDPFEMALRAILGQQVTVKGATTITARLVEHFGDPVPAQLGAPEGLTHFFPTPQRIAALEEAEVATRVGIPAARARAICALAQAVVAGRVDLSGSADSETLQEELMALPGIGRWTAEYLVMRSLGDPDVFPAGDLALRKALSSGEVLTPEKSVRQTTLPWRPWRSYAALLLWQVPLED